ncbi:MAG: MBL fold metallo-hydrolase [Anaerolineales bacterium]|nr:MBL fold metallo-hydrolase [Anaerolineales bacterium]MCS7248271.1 MBL fold metallo-hydrolase [Anaerolineales bacterium]MDW8162085.1 MBL fold metallo-hydrolase [Anaerolineales bacterium]MDW8448195.1 MBL fold metallo-hydrolase [Anaerolineales bacterium]
MKEIRPGIFYEDAYLGVILVAFVFPHGTIYLDAPLKAEDARAWRSALLNQRGGNNRLLILLDSHLDRTIGAKAFDCPILAHEKTASVFRSRPSALKGQTSENGSDWEGYLDSIATRWTVPDITFSEQLSLHWGGPEVRLEHHPGPAPGSIWVSVPSENLIFIGDTVIVNQPPFLAKADLEAWQQSLEELATHYLGYQIYSSRSGLVTVEDIRHQQAFLRDLQNRLEPFTSQNVPPETVNKMVPTLLSHFNFSKDKEELYAKRLQNGLVEYLLRRNRPPSEEEAEMGEVFEDGSEL